MYPMLHGSWCCGYFVTIVNMFAIFHTLKLCDVFVWCCRKHKHKRNNNNNNNNNIISFRIGVSCINMHVFCFCSRCPTWIWHWRNRIYSAHTLHNVNTIKSYINNNILVRCTHVPHTIIMNIQLMCTCENIINA